MGNRARLLGCRSQLPEYFRSGCSLRQLSFVQCLSQAFHHQGQSGQPLAKPVVEFLSDAFLFESAGMNDFPLEFPPCADITRDTDKEPFAINLADGELYWKAGAILAATLNFPPTAEDS